MFLSVLPAGVINDETMNSTCLWIRSYKTLYDLK